MEVTCVLDCTVISLLICRNQQLSEFADFQRQLLANISGKKKLAVLKGLCSVTVIKIFLSIISLKPV